MLTMCAGSPQSIRICVDDIERMGRAFHLTGQFARPAPNRSDFYFVSDRGRLGHPRVYTVGLHRPNPVALEKPYFIGFFASQLSLAERETAELAIVTVRRRSPMSHFPQ